MSCRLEHDFSSVMNRFETNAPCGEGNSLGRAEGRKPRYLSSKCPSQGPFSDKETIGG